MQSRSQPRREKREARALVKERSEMIERREDSE